MVVVVKERDSQHAEDLGLSRAGDHSRMPNDGHDAVFGLPDTEGGQIMLQLLSEQGIKHTTRPH